MGMEEGGYEFDRRNLLGHLPYGPGFLFLDSAFVPGNFKSAQGRYTVPAPEAHPVLRDHFPNLPVFPGHLQAEGAAQLAALLVVIREKEQACFEKRLARPILPLLTASSLTFETFAVPGDSIEYEIFLLSEEGRDVSFIVNIKAGGAVSKGTIKGKIALFGVLERRSRRSLCG